MSKIYYDVDAKTLSDEDGAVLAEDIPGYGTAVVWLWNQGYDTSTGWDKDDTGSFIDATEDGTTGQFLTAMHAITEAETARG